MPSGLLTTVLSSWLLRLLRKSAIYSARSACCSCFSASVRPSVFDFFASALIRAIFSSVIKNPPMCLSYYKIAHPFQQVSIRSFCRPLFDRQQTVYLPPVQRCAAGGEKRPVRGAKSGRLRRRKVGAHRQGVPCPRRGAKGDRTPYGFGRSPLSSFPRRARIK